VECESRSEIEKHLKRWEDLTRYEVIEIYTYRGEEPGE
jgi:hypothetical protein